MSEVFTSVDSITAQFFLDAEQLVIFSQTFRTAWRSCLYLPRTQTNDKICNCRVFRLAGSMRDHDTPAIILRQFRTMVANKMIIINCQSVNNTGKLKNHSGKIVNDIEIRTL